MATRNFVPRGDGEGGIGTSLKRWLNGFFSVLDIKTRLKFGSVDSSTETHEEGKVFYDQEAKTLTLHNDNSEVRHQLGIENLVRIKNVSGATINNGKVIKITGADTQLPTVDLAQADTLSNSNVVGITTSSMADQAFGYALVIGFVNNIDTSSFLVGDKLFLSDTVAGGLTTVPPSIEIFVGYVLVSDATNGRIYANIGTPINAVGDMLKSTYDTNDDGIVEKAFSQSHQEAESTGESSTTSATLQDKTILTFTPPSTGDYILEWYYEHSNSANNKSTRIVIDIDGTPTSDTEYTNANTYSAFNSMGGFKKINLNNTSHTIKIQFSSPALSTAYIKNARLLCRRVN